MTLTLRNVEVAGRGGLDVRLSDGRITEIGIRLEPQGEAVDGRGGALIPGLCDHHIHLLALAARTTSVVLNGVAGDRSFVDRIAAGVASRPIGTWIRVTGYHESMAGELDRRRLDRLAPFHSLRVQHQSGALWILNSGALAALGDGDDPPGLERETGRLWRGDAWLRARMHVEPPPLMSVGRLLASYGVTAVTDASVTTDSGAAAHLADAVKAGDLPLQLTLMSGGELPRPSDGAFEVGPVKVMLDASRLPDFDEFVGRIRDARDWGRAVAVHCVASVELALTLAVFSAAGSQPGDRIEHGGVIPTSAIEEVKALGLTVVTQSGFIRERGDRYLSEVDPEEQEDLYRCASLLSSGVAVAGSSDAPYASADPWLGVAAAIDRRTAGGLIVGAAERLSPRAALGLYLGSPTDPGGEERQVKLGAPADLCLLDAPLAEVLEQPHSARVRATFLGGHQTFTTGT